MADFGVKIEPRTLRHKLSELCSQRGRAERWSGMLLRSGV